MRVFLRVLFYFVASVLFILSVYEILDNDQLINSGLIINLSYALILVYFVDLSLKISSILLFTINKKNYSFVAPIAGKILKWQNAMSLLSIITSLIFSIVFYKAAHLLLAYLFVFSFLENIILFILNMSLKINAVAINDNCIIIQHNKIKTVYFNAVKKIELKYGEWFFVLKDESVVNIPNDITQGQHNEQMKKILEQKFLERGIRLP